MFHEKNICELRNENCDGRMEKSRARFQNFETRLIEHRFFQGQTKRQVTTLRHYYRSEASQGWNANHRIWIPTVPKLHSVMGGRTPCPRSVQQNVIGPLVTTKTKVVACCLLKSGQACWNVSRSRIFAARNRNVLFFGWCLTALHCVHRPPVSNHSIRVCGVSTAAARHAEADKTPN